MKIFNLFWLLILIIGLLGASEIQFGSSDNTFTDGPYIMLEQDSIAVYTIIDTNIIRKTYPKNEIINIKFPEFNKTSKISNWNFKRDKDNFPAADKIFAISDIHGQFDQFISLLKQGKVIDENLNWSFGEGTMVVVGDVFDRGPQVTQILWFIYLLEQEAKQVGGAVHFTLGNHEMMIMQNDNRYIHDNYIEKTEPLTGYSYNELFGKNSLLGRWLRSKNTVIKIGNTLFNHAGLSPKMTNYSISEINSFILENYEKSRNEVVDDEKLSLFFRSWGPLWYRGYFGDGKFYKLISEEDISTVLTEFGVNSIVVGHTTMDNIGTLFDGRVIYVDAGIKYGDAGEAIIFKNQQIFRVTETGIEPLE